MSRSSMSPDGPAPATFVAALAAFAAAAFAPAPAGAQALEPFSAPAGRVVITERSDFSRYEDGRYLGHVYREARVDLEATGGPEGRTDYRGEAIVFEETLRDLRAVARAVDGVVPIAFSLYPGGRVAFSEDEGYPILRGMPAPPPRPAAPGERWTGEGVVVVRPRAGQPATRIPVLAEYRYVGPSKHGDRSAHAIQARFAIRYKGLDRLGDPAMTGATGTRTVDFLVDAEDGSTLFARETLDETYAYSGAPSVRLKGFILHFHRGSVPGEADRIASLLGGTPGGLPQAPEPIAAASPGATTPGAATERAEPPAVAATQPATAPPIEPPVAAEPPAVAEPTATPVTPATPASRPFELAKGERGVVLLLYDLRFVPDGDELLPSERGRLDAIAAALALLPDKTFLVEGHAADLGRPAGQYELSEKRARRIVDEMAARGLPAGRFVYRGLGADRPIAPNDSEAGRARNRRVEITVLE